MADRPQQHPASLTDVLLPSAGAARHARDLLTEACARWQLPHLIEPGSVVVTELVNNAVVHAGTLIDLHVVRGRRNLLILVSDGSSAVPRRPRRVSRHRPGAGLGLVLVDATADQWGCRRVTGGKMVWSALHTGSGPV